MQQVKKMGIEKILGRKVSRFNNSGTPVALVVPKGNSVMYGLGGYSACEMDTENFNTAKGFVVQADFKPGTEEQRADAIKKRAKTKGSYIFQAYFHKSNRASIIVPVANGFHIYTDSGDIRDHLREEGYKVKVFGSNW